MKITAKNAREAATFMLGAAGFLYEVFLGAQERPFIIAACLALMGLPFVLRGEQKIRENANG
jgi:hypothetical protein